MTIEEITVLIQSEWERINTLIEGNEREAVEAYGSHEYTRSRMLYDIRQGLREGQFSLQLILKQIQNPALAGPAVALPNCGGATEPAA